MLSFRFAESTDCGRILDFIKDLAEYEKMSNQVVATEDLLSRKSRNISGRHTDLQGRHFRQWQNDLREPENSVTGTLSIIINISASISGTASDRKQS